MLFRQYMYLVIYSSLIQDYLVGNPVFTVRNGGQSPKLSIVKAKMEHQQSELDSSCGQPPNFQSFLYKIPCVFPWTLFSCRAAVEVLVAACKFLANTNSKPIQIYQNQNTCLIWRTQTAELSYQLWLNLGMHFCMEQRLWILSPVSSHEFCIKTDLRDSERYERKRVERDR